MSRGGDVSAMATSPTLVADSYRTALQTVTISGLTKLGQTCASPDRIWHAAGPVPPAGCHAGGQRCYSVDGLPDVSLTVHLSYTCITCHLDKPACSSMLVQARMNRLGEVDCRQAHVFTVLGCWA